MVVIEAGAPATLDLSIAEVPDSPAVFLLWAREGQPYLARTALLRRRLRRMLGERQKPSRFLNLRETVSRIEYWPTASRLESWVRMYQLAQRHFPDSYLELIKLRMPPYVKVTLANTFPRTQVTAHLGRTGVYYGPFRARPTAEKFETGVLDLFQMRRCQEDLAPSPEHPGCIYGEMAMCLRPCQEVVGPDEYRHEVRRVVQFLETGGESLMESITAARDRSSEEMDFEEAARQHKHLEKVNEALKLRDDLARELDRFHGVAVLPSVAPSSLELFAFQDGWWQEPQRVSFEVQEGKPVSLDARLREAFARMRREAGTLRDRQEYLALLARWYYSSWRDGEWLPYDSPSHIPYRKLVNAISRVARRST
jgi:excinuclease UvrABC nuclease subunit